jgi:uncharacterized protein (DUF58 family)
MLATLQGYFGQLEALLHSAKTYVEQNQFTLALVAAVFALLIFASWLNRVWKRFQAHRELRNTELIAYHLDRIAGSLERLARLQRSEREFHADMTSRSEPTEREVERQPGVGSMFGFGRATSLANPLYRPK